MEVVHHTELINELIKAGKLGLNSGNNLDRIVLHDSCYLGRLNLVYDAPREVIASISGRKPIEMGRHRDKSFCCGAGGGRMWMEEKRGKHINVARVEEALKKDPRTICVCCPYCLTMFADGLKEAKAENSVQVLDLAEIVDSVIK